MGLALVPEGDAMKRIAPSWHVAVPAVLLVLLGCSGDLTLPASTGAPGLAMAVVHGDGQVGTVGEELPAPVVVEVKTDAGEVLPGRRVAFVVAQGAGAGFDPDTVMTNPQGQAETRWVLGTAVGVYTAEARLVPDGETALPIAPLQATADPGAPDTVRALSPAIQPGNRREPLPEPLVVMTVDRFGNPVAGAEVQWETSSGSGDVSVETTLTGSDGTASVIWILGNRIGVQRATAKVEHAEGSPVTFTATVLF
jgi:Bacterial Ig-like domain (group 1)